ncbi:alkane 1-monooxygenase [Cryobacterium roopkundense]|uniref:Alkane 1-monooxygenase n=1 Tax=Cryobacterium roopkundense TaxID=1001240 RepID=A0A099J2L8_9MICO|nr:LLM class flavin-dependent oxidoreductase [Cryobacterium roopkundense]KGJ71688.1 alkane 1-monooxygenase [Cryobacterium roopkundense]MBB5640681.1 luciferase family oxidoreductase group 1 [Cryobacterium roopkundense]
MTIPLSILDLAPIAPGQTARESFAASVALAQTAEKHGYTRVWYAEHHNMPTIASSATAVLVGHVAAQTRSIRLGAGGVMLPNHSPLVIAEQFGTLGELYPGRIDLGLGRAPGSDQTTARAMRRDPRASDQFPQDVMELQAYLKGQSIVAGVQAVPGGGTNVPLYILGSSLFGAQLAAALGLPYAFASHFAPDSLFEAVATYRRDFTPSEQLDKPHVIVAANVVAADDSADAVAQFETIRRTRVRGMISRGPAAPDYTDEQIDNFLTTTQGQQIANMMRYSAVGTPAGVRAFLEDLAVTTKADELILAHQATDIADRLHSVELTAAAMNGALV